MIAINIPMPENCKACPMQTYYSSIDKTWCKGVDRMLAADRHNLSIINRPPWCPLIDLSQYQDDGK